MKTKIYKGNDFVGSVISRQKEVFVTEATDEVKRIVENAKKEGVVARRYGGDGDNCKMLGKIVFEGDPPFLGALLDLLQKQGYRLEKESFSVDKSIKELLGKLPEDSPLKGEVLNELGGMNYLEKTFILTALEKSVKRK